MAGRRLMHASFCYHFQDLRSVRGVEMLRGILCGEAYVWCRRIRELWGVPGRRFMSLNSDQPVRYLLVELAFSGIAARDLINIHLFDTYHNCKY